MLRKCIAGLLAAAALASAADFRLNDDHGRPISLAAYKGKVVLLNFWATWCHGCVQEIPWFIEFQKRYEHDGLQVIGVSMDADGWTKVRPYMRASKVNYPVVIGSDALGKRFGLASMPMTLLIRRDGTVASTHAGVVDRTQCEQEIRGLLGKQ